MLRYLEAFFGTAQNKLGLTSIACDCGCVDPDEMQHLWSDEPEDDTEPADCGSLGNAANDGPLCPWCAEIHADQPWIQRLLR